MKVSTHMVPGEIKDFAELIEHGGRLADQRRFGEARRFFVAALRVARAARDQDKVGHALRSLAKFYRKSSQPLQAVASYKAAQEHLSPDSLEWAYVQMGLGLTYYEMGRPEDAIPFLEDALKVLEANGASPHLEATLVNLGASLADVGRPDEARPYLERAIRHLFAAKNTTWLAYAYTEMAKVELASGRPEAALQQTRLAMDLATERQDAAELGRALIVAAGAYAAQGRLTKGLRYLSEAVNLLSQEKAWSDVLRATTLRREIENRLIKE